MSRDRDPRRGRDLRLGRPRRTRDLHRDLHRDRADHDRWAQVPPWLYSELGLDAAATAAWAVATVHAFDDRRHEDTGYPEQASS